VPFGDGLVMAEINPLPGNHLLFSLLTKKVRE